MKLNDLVNGRSEWLKGQGPRSDIAISTRVRVARNVKGALYFNRASEKEREKTLAIVNAAIKKSAFFKKALHLKIRDISELDKIFLVERHLMSREHMYAFEHKGLIVDANEIVSAMINEEDHIRLQVLQSGFNIIEAWRILNEIDTDLAKYVNYDFSHKFGYLTSCPTNTGTGIRASVMLHLSGLVIAGQIDNIFDAISKLGLTMRGFYGEGTESLGDFFQISNQVTLGHSEVDILDNLERVINKIIVQEETTRLNLLKKKKEEMADRIYRSYGTLKSARIITSKETVKLLSAVRLGAALGIIEDIDAVKINEILLIVQPAHLQKITEKKMDTYERDVKRADLIRERLGLT